MYVTIRKVAGSIHHEANGFLNLSNPSSRATLSLRCRLGLQQKAVADISLRRFGGGGGAHTLAGT
jgi:hypothetical protein